MLKTTVTIAFLPFFLAAAGPALAQEADSAVSLRGGVYTAEQARRGEVLYRDACSQCHMSDYFGDTWLRSWAGAPLIMLFDLVTTSMPEDRPGSLEPQQYADVLAYIFEQNGLPAGSRELPPDTERLEQILIERSK